MENKMFILISTSLLFLFLLAVGLINNADVDCYDSPFIYECRDWDSHFYDCPTALSFKNFTGQYCNNTLICENHIKNKEYEVLIE